MDLERERGDEEREGERRVWGREGRGWEIVGERERGEVAVVGKDGI